VFAVADDAAVGYQLDEDEVAAAELTGPVADDEGLRSW